MKVWGLMSFIARQLGRAKLKKEISEASRESNTEEGKDVGRYAEGKRKRVSIRKK